MNEHKMIIDVSHISVKGFWDVIETTNMPIIASHSNSFELKDHKRNLNREQIEAIIKNKGCIGINFYSEFLTDGKCRKLEKPKKKKQKHLQGTNHVLQLNENFTNADIRKALAQFKPIQ